MKYGILIALMAMVAAVSLAQAPTAPPVFPATPAPATPETRHIIILHTNDLHGFLLSWRGWEGDMAGKRIGGITTLGAAIGAVRAQQGPENVLLLDGGDAVGDPSDASRGVPVLQAMHDLGYRAMTLGSYDFASQVQTLGNSPLLQGMDLVAANVVDAQTNRPVLKPYIVQSVGGPRGAGGVRVGILGLAYPGTPVVTPQRAIPGLKFLTDSAAVVRQYLPELQRQSDVIVVLSHLGLAADQQLAGAVDGIDVIVGGESHNRLAAPVRVGRTLIVQAGAMGSDLGRLDLTIENNRPVAFRHDLVLLDNARIPADPAMQRLVGRYQPQEQANPLAQALLGTAQTAVPRANVFALQQPVPADNPSPADMLFADAIRQQTNADVAILPGRRYGPPLGPGDVRGQDVRWLIPGDARVVSFALTGEQLEHVLEQSIQNTYATDPAQQVMGLVQVSGMTFRFAPNSARGAAVSEIQVGGRPLDLKRTYAVAVDSLMADGGGGFVMLRDLPRARDWGSESAMISDWIRQRGTVAAPNDVRFVRTEPPPGEAIPAAAPLPAGAR